MAGEGERQAGRHDRDPRRAHPGAERLDERAAEHDFLRGGLRHDGDQDGEGQRHEVAPADPAPSCGTQGVAQRGEARLGDDREDALRDGEKTPFGVVGAMLGEGNTSGPAAAWALQLSLAYLDHLEALGEAERTPGTDPVLWRSTG